MFESLRYSERGRIRIPHDEHGRNECSGLLTSIDIRSGGRILDDRVAVRIVYPVVILRPTYVALQCGTIRLRESDGNILVLTIREHRLHEYDTGDKDDL